MARTSPDPNARPETLADKYAAEARAERIRNAITELARACDLNATECDALLAWLALRDSVPSSAASKHLRLVRGRK